MTQINKELDTQRKREKRNVEVIEANQIYRLEQRFVLLFTEQKNLNLHFVTIPSSDKGLRIWLGSLENLTLSLLSPIPPTREEGRRASFLFTEEGLNPWSLKRLVQDFS